ncbi:DUF2325 domain-containing protein [Halobacillus fulvus]|nr:DUF2325 domain-containing protein [Halobacillus fulvus]
MKSTIAVLGGHKEKVFLEAGDRLGAEVSFLKPFKKSHIRSKLMKIIKRADSVVIIGGCCSHKDMWEAKRIAKLYGRTFCVERSQGAANAIRKGLMLLK